MGKVTVVISYDDEEGAPYHDLAIEVVKKVRPLFVGKRKFEVHIANGGVALQVLTTLADRRIR